MFAIIESGGKQYKVSQGDVIQIEKIDVPIGETITLDKVLMAGEGAESAMGIPYVEGCKVTGEIMEQLQSKKIIVFKKRRRKNYRRKNGHRQRLTRVKITGIQKA